MMIISKHKRDTGMIQSTIIWVIYARQFCTIAIPLCLHTPSGGSYHAEDGRRRSWHGDRTWGHLCRDSSSHTWASLWLRFKIFLVWVTSETAPLKLVVDSTFNWSYHRIFCGPEKMLEWTQLPRRDHREAAGVENRDNDINCSYLPLPPPLELETKVAEDYTKFYNHGQGPY